MPFRPLKPDEQQYWNKNICSDPQHDPPTMIVLPPGLHVWVCPNCGKEQRVIVPEVN